MRVVPHAGAFAKHHVFFDNCRGMDANGHG
jgi:hypothetical protein